MQKRATFNVFSAYRTVSEQTVLIIAGVVPITLMAKECKVQYLKKTEVKKKMASQEERENSGVGRHLWIMTREDIGPRN